MSLINKLIEKRVSKIGTKNAKAAAKIFKQHKDCLEELIPEDPEAKWPSLDSMISIILNHQYGNLPPPIEIDHWYQHTVDIKPKLAKQLREDYWDLQSYFFKLNRTDISKKDKVKYFAKVPKLYNNVMTAMSKMAVFEKDKKPEQHYDIT